MDNFKIIYKILKVFEKNLDVEEPDWEDLTPQKLNISEVLWQNLIQMLIKACLLYTSPSPRDTR